MFLSVLHLLITLQNQQNKTIVVISIYFASVSVGNNLVTSTKGQKEKFEKCLLYSK